MVLLVINFYLLSRFHHVSTATRLFSYISTNYVTSARASSFPRSKGDQTSFHERRTKSPR